MDYVEFKEWKELKKEKKYKEAVDNLMDRDSNKSFMCTKLLFRRKI